MHPEGPTHTADVAAASWIRPRLATDFGTVGSVVPAGYPAYARLLHPVEDGERLRRWSDVAAATGRTVHPLVQWHRLVGAVDPRGATDGQGAGPPRVGELVPEHLAALLDVLAGHTGTPDDCWACVWEGYAWVAKVPGSIALFGFTDDGEPPVLEHGPPGFTAEQLAGPRVRHPNRSYLLLRGPLTSVRLIGDQVTPDWFDPQSPNLWWPADRTWCVGTEIDLDSTLVAGSRALVDELLAHPVLEAVEVQPGDSLAWDADELD